MARQDWKDLEGIAHRAEVAIAGDVLDVTKIVLTGEGGIGINDPARTAKIGFDGHGRRAVEWRATGTRWPRPPEGRQRAGAGRRRESGRGHPLAGPGTPDAAGDRLQH